MGNKKEYGDPKEGSKTHKILTLMLRPEGATVKEVFEVCQVNHSYTSSVKERLSFDFGYEIKGTKCTDLSRVDGAKGKVYKVVGRYAMNGKYTSHE